MKELKLFICECCGTQYKDKIEAKKCEDSHKTKLKIKSLKFVNYKNDNTGFPKSIEIEDEKGNIISYKRY